MAVFPSSSDSTEHTVFKISDNGTITTLSTKMRRSYACAPLLEPHMYETVPDRLRCLSEADPDREAFVFYDFELNRVPVTRKQLFDTSVKLGKALAHMGIQKGDTIAFCMNNSVEMLYANMAVITAGGVPFYISTKLRDGSDVTKSMVEMDSKMLFIDAKIGDDNWRILEGIWPLDANASTRVPALKHVIYNGITADDGSGRTSLSSLIYSSMIFEKELPFLDPEDILAYLVTSGSTGDAKNVAYTHFSLLNWTRSTNLRVRLQEYARFFNDRQFSWAVGYPRTYLATGATRIFIDTRISISGKHIDCLAGIIEKERCDWMYVTGYVAKDLIQNPQLKTKFKTVQDAFIGGERVPKANIVLKDEFFKNIHTYYGTTETGGAICFSSHNNEDYEDGIVGTPLEGVELKLIDSNGAAVEFGKSGELCVRTPWRFVEYRGNEALFREVIDDKNWFHTGDIAHFRDDGNLVIDGRKKEFVVISTGKYFPWNVEQALKDCPGAQFVIVVGVPDDRFSNVFCACVVPQTDVILTADDVKRYCDDVFLEEGIVEVITTKPRYCLIFDKLMLTTSGKIDRRGMTKEAKERLGL